MENATLENTREYGTVIEELVHEIKALQSEARLSQQWYTLEEACCLKGISKKTAQNQTWLQPRGGVEDAVVGRKKRWHRSTIIEWLDQTDQELRS